MSVKKSSNIIGGYQLIGLIGQGGMGDVYLSVRKGPGGFNKLLVIKELRPALASDAEFLSMFLEEARLAARLNHPNVVQTYEVGCDDDRYFIAMEYLDGQSLQQVIAELFRTRKECPVGLALSILDEVLSGLSYAHTLTNYDGTPLSVVHRDITPQNIFVTYDGQVKIVDFGIAKALDSAIETRNGSFKGKLGYVAPEQVAGSPVDDRADIFSVGVILWEILARRRIWRGLPQVAIMNCILSGEIPSITDIRPDVPSALADIVSRATAPNPNERYQTAAELSAAFVDYLNESSEPHLRQRDIGKAVSTLLSKRREGISTVLNEQILKRLKDGDCDSYIPNLIPQKHSPSHVGKQEIQPYNTVSPIVWTSVSEIHIAPRTAGDDETVNYRIPHSGSVKKKISRYGMSVGIGLIALALVTALLFRTLTIDDERSVSLKSDSQSGDVEINAVPVGSTTAPPSMDGNRILVELSGDIETDAVLESNQEYLLKFTTYVRPGATLTIRPGATIRGDKATRGTLVVEPGGKIIAEGTPEHPIVFTSNQPPNQRRPGDWGGIIIMGEAPINLRGENGEAVPGQVEGIVKRGEYGGRKPDDNSGVMSYIRIEYSGVEIAPNNEINGLTLAGVGRGTRIDHIQVRFTTDDCFEFFGGTVNASYLVCHAAGDDGFDWDLGYTGHLQYLVFVSDPSMETPSNGFEGDNDPDGTLNTPISKPFIYNATLVGASGGRKSSERYGMLFKGATRAHVANVLVTGFTAGIDVRDPLTQVDIESSVFFGNAIHEIAFPEQENIRRGPNADDDGSIDERALVLDPARGNKIRDPKLIQRTGVNTPPIKPQSRLSSTTTPPDNGFFDTSAAFVGAFRDTNDSWDEPWVVWNNG